jgi:hypothetical protein
MAGMRMEDGKHYRANREGGKILVDDHHVDAINRMDGNGTAGLLNAAFREYGTSGKPGRRCTGCGRIYYAWTMTCPRPSCGAATEPEAASAVQAAAASPEIR